MYQMVLQDEYGKTLGKTQFQNFSNPTNEKIDVPIFEYQQILNKIYLGVDVMLPINNGKDFAYISPSNYIQKTSNLTFEQIQGRILSKIFPQTKELGLIKLIQNVYKTKQTKDYQIKFYKNDNIYDVFNFSIITYKNLVYMVFNKEKDQSSLYEEENVIFNNSLQGIAILQDGITVKSNQAHANLLGAKPEDLIGRLFDANKVQAEGLTSQEILNIINSIAAGELFYYDIDVRIRKDDGGYSYFRCVLTPIMFNNRPATRVSSINITEKKKIEQEALILTKNLSKIQGMTKVAIANWTPQDQYNWTSEAYKILEINPDEFNKEDNLIDLHTLNKISDFKTRKNKATPEDKESSRLVKIMTGKNNIKYLYVANVYEFDEKNKVSNVYAFIQDVTEIINHQNQLNAANKKLKESLKNNQLLYREIHHRVKNNLQIILSLINLDQRYNKNNSEEIIKSTRNRINSMALIHELTYHSDELLCNFTDYIHSEINNLFKYYSINNINVEYDLEDLNLNIDLIIPLGLIINELITNIIQHAFPDGNGGNVKVSLKKQDNTQHCELIISDDGVGIIENFDLLNSSNLGMTIVKGLLNQIDGKLSILESEQGLSFSITFDLID
jgi:PAS domain S-box-containing protein